MIWSTDGYHIAERNPELPTAGIVPYQKILVEWGKEGDRIKIKRTFYPRTEYTFEQAEEAAKKLETCPLCTSGRVIGSETGQEKIPSPNPGQTEANSIWLPILGLVAIFGFLLLISRR